MPALARISDALDAALADTGVPGAVAMVVNAEGVLHASAHGTRAAGDDAPMTLDTVFRLFSMTKAIGSTMAMKLVEDRLLSLDTPVAEILPDFAQIQVLDGWDGDAPRLRAPRTPCTLRHLATHTSGLTYDIWNEGQHRYTQATGGKPTLSGDKSALQCFPMQFDPGTAWAYGMGTDWLGLMVEAATGAPIGDVLEDALFAPLGMTDTSLTFRPDMTDRKAAVHANGPEGFKVIGMELPQAPEFFGMGHALNGTAPDYARFCRMILRGGELDGTRVLAPATVTAMLQNAMGDLRLTPQPTQNPGLGADIDLFPEVEKTHTPAFMRVEADVPGRRRAGSVGWAGLLNTHFWIDPAGDRAGVLLMQHLPFIDPAAVAVYDAFERAVYADA